MSLKPKVHVLGLGSCGGNFYKGCVEKSYNGATANGSSQDLRALGDVPAKFQLKGFDGFGGHREKALECLEVNEEFLEYVQNIKEDIVFIFFGGGGSTGSGCAVIVAELLLEEKDDYGRPKKIVCPVIALPSSDEPIVKQRNAYQAVQELQDLEGLGATFFINNDSSDDYKYINSNFINMLDTFLDNDSYGELNNFDESERLEMLRDSGAMVFSLVGTGKETSVMLDKLTGGGIFAPIEGNKVCENIGIIHAGNNNSDIDASMVINEVGKPKNVFEGYNAKRTLVTVSGLDYPVTHIKKLGELAQKAFEERQRNKKQSGSKRLTDLDFFAEETVKIEPQNQKKPSKLEMLRKRQGNIRK